MGTERNKRIDHLVDKIHEIETISMDTGSELLEGELSPEERERILQRAVAEVNRERTGKSPAPMPDRETAARARGTRTEARGKIKSKTKKILAAAVAAVFLFTTTAVAADFFQWDQRLAQFLGINESNSVKMAGSAMDINVAAEQNGVSLKAVQALGDASHVYILLELTTPEGTKIDPNSRFDMIYARVEGVTGAGYSCDILPDEAPDDNQATLLFSMEANKDINDKIINLRFQDLARYDPQKEEMVVDFPGNWELEWKLDYEDCSIRYDTDQALSLAGSPVRIEGIEVSPIGIKVRLRGDYFKAYDAAPPDPSAGDPVQIKAVTLKDGRVLQQADFAGWGMFIEGDRALLNMQMKGLLDQEQILSITLNDTVIPLGEEKR